MDKLKRQIRFLQKARNLKKWARLVKARYTMFPEGEAKERYIRKLANHGKTCSCRMCGNPRKWYGHKTMQELKADKINFDDFEQVIDN